MVAPIFVCYRRDDSSAAAGRLRDAIAHMFSQRAVFLDHSSIHPGEKWRREIQKQLAQAKIVIAIIGPEWLRVSDEWGVRRIDSPDDWVRRELETALSKKNLLLLPVLVSGAKLPPRNKMPKSLGPLLDRQALELRDSFWGHDVKLVLERIKSILPLKQLENSKRGPYPIPPADKPDPISKRQLQAALKGPLKNWKVVQSSCPDGNHITKTELFREYEFPSFRDAVGFMYQLAPGCDIAIHHPRWENIWRTLRVYLTTWDINQQISDRDIQLAKYFDQAYAEIPQKGKKPNKAK